jgi:hypothetical protein
MLISQMMPIFFQMCQNYPKIKLVFRLAIKYFKHPNGKLHSYSGARQCESISIVIFLKNPILIENIKDLFYDA